jgi:hypothetical protein
MTARTGISGLVVAGVVLAPTLVSTQVNFSKSGYYVAMGDSVAAGEGALPVTSGYAYDLYDRGVFGRKQTMDFANVAVRGARSWELRDFEVGQVLCAEPALRPTVVTITAGANDFLHGDTDIFGIAYRIVEAVDRLLNNDAGLVANPVLDPATGAPCRALEDVTILVSNYYRIPHPEPAIAAQLDAALQGFDQALRYLLQLVTVPGGSRVAVVDLYTPSVGREGLVLVERRGGYGGLFDFDAHPTNLGHAFIAEQFEAAWESLQ